MQGKIALGFTIIEVAITLAVAAITLGIGVPVMGNLISSNRVAGQVNALRGALALTRSEAVKRNLRVVLCKSVDGEHCTKKGSWDSGWIVYADRNHNRQRDKQEPLMLSHGRLTNGHTLTYRGFGSSNYIAYRPTGFTQMNGTFILCAREAPSRSKALILMKTGRVRLSTTRPDGSPLGCRM